MSEGSGFRLMRVSLSVPPGSVRPESVPPGSLPETLGALRGDSRFSSKLDDSGAWRSVKEELRQNLICKLQKHETLFPGIVGYEDTVVPQVVNAVLSRHNFILLGLRGQAKTKLIRMLITLLDERLPYVAGCEIRDDPFATPHPSRGYPRKRATSKSWPLQT